MVEKFKNHGENLIPEEEITPERIINKAMGFFQDITPDELGVTVNSPGIVKATRTVSEDLSSSITTHVAYEDALLTIPLATHKIFTERAANGEATSHESYSIVKRIPEHLIRIQFEEINKHPILIDYGGRHGPPQNFEKSELIFISAVLKI